MRSIRAINFSIASLFIILMSQCGNRDIVLSPQITNLIGTWRLIEPDSSYGITLQFTYDSANPPVDITPFKVNGKSSVNAYTARLYATVDGTMQINEIGSTERAGSPAATQIEQTYLANLQTVVRYELPTDNRLRMYHGGNQPGVLVFAKVN